MGKQQKITSCVGFFYGGGLKQSHVKLFKYDGDDVEAEVFEKKKEDFGEISARYVFIDDVDTIFDKYVKKMEGNLLDGATNIYASTTTDASAILKDVTGADKMKHYNSKPKKEKEEKKDTKKKDTKKKDTKKKPAKDDEASDDDKETKPKKKPTKKDDDDDDEKETKSKKTTKEGSDDEKDKKVIKKKESKKDDAKPKKGGKKGAKESDESDDDKKSDDE